MSTQDASHPFVPPGPDDSRAPCPGLNALANHGYLPHDGRNLTLTQLVTAMRSVYGISCPLGLLLGGVGLAKCGHWRGARRVLDLHELGRHGVLEHDGSLVHADVAAPGDAYAPTQPDPGALRQLLESRQGQGQGQGQGDLTLGDLCERQVARQDATRPLSKGMAALARGEVGLLYRAFGVPGPSKGSGDASLEKEKGPSLDLIRGEGDAGERVVPRAFLEQWLGEERLPEGWEGPVEGTGLFELFGLAREIKTLKDQIRRSGAEGDGSKGASG